jgi:hypothetical protein
MDFRSGNSWSSTPPPPSPPPPCSGAFETDNCELAAWVIVLLCVAAASLLVLVLVVGCRYVRRKRRGGALGTDHPYFRSINDNAPPLRFQARALVSAGSGRVCSCVSCISRIISAPRTPPPPACRRCAARAPRPDWASCHEFEALACWLHLPNRLYRRCCSRTAVATASTTSRRTPPCPRLTRKCVPARPTRCAT